MGEGAPGQVQSAEIGGFYGAIAAAANGQAVQAAVAGGLLAWEGVIFMPVPLTWAV